MIENILTIDGDNIAHFSTFVSSSQTDANYNTRLSVYQALTQEAAGLHAAVRGVGIPSLQKEGKTWVIARSRMEIFHYGAWGDNITVNTFVQNASGLNCPRVVEGVDDNGNLIFSTMTRWVVIDMKTGRPLRPSDVTAKIQTPKEEFQKNPNLPNLIDIVNASKVTLLTYEPHIQYLDTDSNKHVNNLSYTNWMIEALPTAFNDSYKPSLVDVKWIRQTYRGDKLIVTVKAVNENMMSEDEPKLYFDISRVEEDGKLTQVFEAYSEWKKRELMI